MSTLVSSDLRILPSIFSTKGTRSTRSREREQSECPRRTHRSRPSVRNEVHHSDPFVDVRERERETCRGFQMYYESPHGDEELLRGQHERNGEKRVLNGGRRPLPRRQVDDWKQDEKNSFQSKMICRPWPENWKERPRRIDEVFQELNVQLFDGKLSCVSIQWTRRMTRYATRLAPILVLPVSSRQSVCPLHCLKLNEEFVVSFSTNNCFNRAPLKI